MAAPLQLRAGEVLQGKFLGDYWQRCVLGYNRKCGKFYITNQRICIQARFSVPIDIEMQDIVEIRKCNVQVIMPTGIDIILRNGDAYRISVLGRGKKMEMIQKFI